MKAASVVNCQLRFATKRLGHDLPEPSGVELLELLVVESGGERSQGAVYLHVGRHVIALTGEAMERRLGELGEPYKQGQASVFGQIGQACIGVGAILAAGPARNSRPAAAAAGALLSIGALGARWSVFRAGFQSAADPKYVVEPQRAAVQRGERPGAARREARVSSPGSKAGSPATAV